VLNAFDYGVPQVRRRVFYCGWREGELPPFEFPEAHPCGAHQTVWATIGDLPEPPADHTPHPADPLHRRTKLSPLNVERLRRIPAGGGMEDLPPEMRVDCHKDGPSRIGHRYVYGRLDPAKPSATITARFDSFTRGKFGHPFQDRSITLREGARLQTFPDSFRFTGGQEDIAALIGNAVPPVLGEVLGSAILDHLTSAAARCAASQQLGLFS
jgi:DNA (cytosine-5)-methyltransferase 1